MSWEAWALLALVAFNALALTYRAAAGIAKPAPTPGVAVVSLVEMGVWAWIILRLADVA